MDISITRKTVVDRINISYTPEELRVVNRALKQAYPKVWASACGKTGTVILKMKAAEEEIGK